MVEEDIKKCKSFSEVARLLLGITYYNAAVKEKIKHICQERYKIDIETIVKQNRKNIRKCLFCGKEIVGGGRKKFCDSSCAASFNNKKRGKHSQVTKDKIRKTLLKRYSENQTGSPKGRKKYPHVCPTCQKNFIGRKNQKYCSIKCARKSPITKEIIREKVKEKIKNGTFQGWKTRNIKSYPEIFFENVLTNNEIKFKREDFSTKKYFLDFFIEKNGSMIDLEIDGKQHQYRKDKDHERDLFLSEKGFIVYRISWNEINTEKGKKEMKDKINKFLSFYNSL